MADLVVSCIVKRTSLSLTDLQLHDDATPGFRVVEFGPGNVTWRRTMVNSPYVNGSFPTAQVKENGDLHLKVRVQAANASDLGQYTDYLVQAFSQWTYEVDFVLNSSATRRWQCYPAEITVGDSGAFQKAFLHHHWQEFTLAIPRNPVPLQGAL